MIAEGGMAIARERIAKELEEKTGFLNLGGLGLTELPEELATLVHLKSLNLGMHWRDPDGKKVSVGYEAGKDNRLDGISWSVFEKLEHLDSLFAARCGLSQLAFLAGFPNLACLWFDHNPCVDLGPLAGLASLQSIDCSATQVSDLGPLAGLASLQSIDCFFTQVSDLRPLAGLASLQSIDCSDTQVSDLVPLSGLATLRSIDCSETQVSDLVPLANIASLQSIDCSVTEVSDLTPLSSLTSLRRIYCYSAQVSDLTPLSGLASLESLVCSSMPVSDLKPLAGLASLLSIDCSETKVSDLGPLAGLASLQSFDCRCTQVSDLGPLAGLASLQSIDCVFTQVSDLRPLAGLASLQSFDCRCTQVSDLGPLSGLESLQSIDCSDTQVSDLRPLSGLASLQSISCSRTQVSDLGPLSGLASLQSIDCSYTQVSDLGPLARIAALQSISASSIPIHEISEALVFKPALQNLQIMDVPSTGLPAEVLSTNAWISCLESLRSHYLDLRNGSAPLPDIKIMVLGNGRIGKTQICRRIRGEPYEPDADSTHGITVTSTSFGSGSSARTESLLHLWDFGGQDIYHGTHALFMRSRAVFFTVWTPSSEDRTEHEHRGIRFRNHRLDYWLELVRQLGGANSPVLLIQTQCDAVEDELRHPPVPDALLDQFGFCKVLHYSSREDRGRASLDEALNHAIQWTRKQQGDVRIGTGRLKVRRRLEKLRDEDAALPATERKNRVLKKEFFVRICEEEGGVSNPDHLIAYLHECGVIFHRPGVFEDAIILDQEWALEAIYTLFNREKCWRQLRQLNGRFTRSLLATLVWQDYEEGEQALFIEMMESAGICFVHREGDSRSRTETEYIAPDLLPEVSGVEEELAAFWQDESAEEQILDFPFEHPGLVRNVIARIGKSAGMNAVYWKGGVCGYERKTHSAIRIDTLPPSEDKPYQLRLQIRTQRGRAKELLEQAIVWIREEARQSGCQAFDSAIASPKLRSKPERFSDEKPEDDDRSPGKEPDFGPPPRKAGKSYCVSYAWNKESEEFVDQLCADAVAEGIEVIRDKTHLGLGERISKFMNRLGAGDRVFVILSEKYLQSPFCMFELFEVWNQSKKNDGDFLKRVRVYRLPDAKIGTVVERMRIGVFWKQQFEEISGLIKEHGAEVIGGDDFKRFKMMQEFALHVGDILGLVMDTLQPQNLEELERFSFDLTDRPE